MNINQIGKRIRKQEFDKKKKKFLKYSINFLDGFVLFLIPKRFLQLWFSTLFFSKVVKVENKEKLKSIVLQFYNTGFVYIYTICTYIYRQLNCFNYKIALHGIVL